MSVSTTAQPPARGRRTAKLWIAILFLLVAGVALAWLGAGSIRGEATASGLNIRTIEAGTGPYVQAVDGVLIEYEGRLNDGTVFDSSEGRGPQPLIAGQTIPGFAEALTMMQKGGRYRVKIPSALAYGAEPPPGSVPPNSDLEFDVHLVQVVPNAAMMTGPAGPEGGLPPEAQPQGQPGSQPQAPPQAPTPPQPE